MKNDLTRSVTFIILLTMPCMQKTKQKKPKGCIQDPKKCCQFFLQNQKGEERKVVNLSKGENPSWEEGLKCEDTRLYDGKQNTAA